MKIKINNIVKAVLHVVRYNVKLTIIVNMSKYHCLRYRINSYQTKVQLTYLNVLADLESGPFEREVNHWKPIIRLGGFAYHKISSRFFSPSQNMKTKHAHECKFRFHTFQHLRGGDELPMSKQERGVT